MNKFIMLSAAAALLAACADEASEVVVDPDEVVEDDEDVIAVDGAVTVGDVEAGDFDSDADTLDVVITLDGNDIVQEYGEDGTLLEYTRFFQQLSDTDRAYTALAGESSDGSVQAVVVMDGGQFNRFFGGAIATQNNYTAPDGGIVNYTGGYVGLVNFGLNAGGIDGSISGTPNESSEVTGQVFFKADFSDNSVNGAIFDRELDGILGLPEIVLTVADINSDGSFTGTVEKTDLTGVGSYTGVFGGEGEAVAGVINLGPGFFDFPADDDDDDDDDVESVGNGFEQEYGIFVLDAEGSVD